MDLWSTAEWHSEQGAPVPKRLESIDDTWTADQAFRLASEGVGLLWQGDFQNAKQMVQALARRYDSRQKKHRSEEKPFPEAFHHHRLKQLQRSRLLGSVLIQIQTDATIGLRRVPDIRDAISSSYGQLSKPRIVSLREILGIIGAYEWEKKGVFIPALGATMHPRYGVYSPHRGEYIDLIEQAPLPLVIEQHSTAFDIGTGTGVLACLLAKRGIQSIVATDSDERAVGCAKHNIECLQLTSSIAVKQCHMFPEGQAALLVCNPPWLPGKPSSSIEGAIYDPDHQMLKQFVMGVKAHLIADGQAWLVMSDLAEHLKLRSDHFLTDLFSQAGLKVHARYQTKPKHGKAHDANDPLYQARSKEITSLWVLQPE